MRDNPLGMLWFTSFSSVRPTSRVGYDAGKPIESVVYCLDNAVKHKTDPVPGVTSNWPELCYVVNLCPERDRSR